MAQANTASPWDQGRAAPATSRQARAADRAGISRERAQHLVGGPDSGSQNALQGLLFGSMLAGEGHPAEPGAQRGLSIIAPVDRVKRIRPAGPGVECPRSQQHVLAQRELGPRLAQAGPE